MQRAIFAIYWSLTTAARVHKKSYSKVEMCTIAFSSFSQVDRAIAHSKSMLWYWENVFFPFGRRFRFGKTSVFNQVEVAWKQKIFPKGKEAVFSVPERAHTMGRGSINFSSFCQVDLAIAHGKSMLWCWENTLFPFGKSSVFNQVELDWKRNLAQKRTGLFSLHQSVLSPCAGVQLTSPLFCKWIEPLHIARACRDAEKKYPSLLGGGSVLGKVLFFNQVELDWKRKLFPKGKDLFSHHHNMLTTRERCQLTRTKDSIATKCISTFVGDLS